MAHLSSEMDLYAKHGRSAPDDTRPRSEIFSQRCMDFRSGQSQKAREAEANLKIAIAEEGLRHVAPDQEFNEGEESEGSDASTRDGSFFEADGHTRISYPWLLVRSRRQDYIVDLSLLKDQSAFFRHYFMINETRSDPMPLTVPFGEQYLESMLRFMHDPATVCLGSFQPERLMVRKRLGFQMGMPTEENLQSFPLGLRHLRSCIDIYVIAVALGAPRTMRYCLQMIEDTAWAIRNNTPLLLQTAQQGYVHAAALDLKSAMNYQYQEELLPALLMPIRFQLAGVLDALIPLMLHFRTLHACSEVHFHSNRASSQFPIDYAEYKSRQISRRIVIRSLVPTEVDLQNQLDMATQGIGCVKLSLLV